MKALHINFMIVCALCFCGCGLPDLADPKVLQDAQKLAIPLDTLQRKLMYGMIRVYTNKAGEPFTGWVREINHSNGEHSIGYLKSGRREGLWFSWDANHTKRSEIKWSEDRMEGCFLRWHQDGLPAVCGQTKDGEVDGEWVEYYLNGNMHQKSLNQVGHLVHIQVWKPNGSLCQESAVSDGNGTFLDYHEDGSRKLRRTFVNGVETNREDF